MKTLYSSLYLISHKNWTQALSQLWSHPWTNTILCHRQLLACWQLEAKLGSYQRLCMEITGDWL